MLQQSIGRFALAAVMGFGFAYGVNVSGGDFVITEDGDYEDCDSFFAPYYGVPVRYLGTIDPVEGCDYDGFRFDLASDRDITIVTNSPGDTAIELLHCNDGEILGCDDDSNPGCASGYCSQISGCLPGDYNYCVRVRPFSAGSAFDYVLDIQDNGACTAQYPPVVTSDMRFTCEDPYGGSFDDSRGCQSDSFPDACIIVDPFFGGACCLAPHSQRICSDDWDFSECEAAGGLYAGDGTDCSDPLLCDALLVTIDSLSAVATATGVEVSWVTALEIDTVAFRVLRESGRREKTLQLVAEILTTGSDLEGQAYSMLDDAPEALRAKQYYLEDIDIYGKVTRHGPVVVERSGPTGSRSRD